MNITSKTLGRFLYSESADSEAEQMNSANPGSDTNEQRVEGASAADSTENGDSGADISRELQDLKKQLADKDLKIAETHERMLRVAADFDNSRKRWEKERLDVRQYSIQEFARDLLPVIDAFDKAMAAIESSEANLDNESGKQFGSVIEGVQLVSKVFLDSVKKHGIEKLPGQGHPFNPMYHNAVAKLIDSTVNQEMVIDEYTPGYKIGDRVLRTAMVRVAAPD